MVVDPDDPGADPSGDLVCLDQVVGPDGTTQAKGRIVGQADRLLLVVKGQDSQDRSEQLGLEQGGVVVEIRDHLLSALLRECIIGFRVVELKGNEGGLVPISFVQVSLFSFESQVALPAAEQFQATVCRRAFRHDGVHQLHLRFLDHRTKGRGHGKGIAHALLQNDGFDLAFQFLAHDRINFLLDQKPRSGDAGLSRSDKGPERAAVDDGIQVGVQFRELGLAFGFRGGGGGAFLRRHSPGPLPPGRRPALAPGSPLGRSKDDHGGLAPQFLGHLADAGPGQGPNGGSRPGPPRKVDLANPGIAHQSGSHRPAPQHDAQDPLREPGIQAQQRQFHDAGGGLLARFEDDAVAGGEGRRQFLDGDQQRVVEGGDLRHDPQRQPGDQVDVIPSKGRGARPARAGSQQGRIVQEPLVQP
mmetsp:Transcript_19595/g.54652  ORF Transcript_19595/g.54652 Transcript_19595/m.54652 type:complete len:415 (-) Transcript_19595:1398-2642(-)